MIIDLAQEDAPPIEPYDVCVVGSGPAGMTVAMELAGEGLRVAVLESGRARYTRHGDRLRRVVSEGIRIKDYSRERVLGGTSTTWSGLGSLLDSVDVAPRAFLRHSGWPLDLDELRPYYDRAAAGYGFAPAAMFEPGAFDRVREGGDPTPDWIELEEKTFLANAVPQDFGALGRPVFEAPGTDAFLDATVLRLERDGAESVVRAVARTRRGRELRLEAAVFVLAAGGIENARLLLASDGLGNERDQVGRYLMNHPKNPCGIIRLAKPVKELPYHFGCLHRGFAGYGGLRLREELQRERGLLNAYVRFEPLFPWRDNPGVESLIFLAKRSQRLFAVVKERARDKLVFLRDYAETGDDSALKNDRKGFGDWIRIVLAIVFHLPMVLRYVLVRLRRGAHPPVTLIRLRNFMEMEPDPENRVTLAEKTDVYGQPLARVRHQTTALDRASLVRLHEVLGSELARSGFGELESGLGEADPWPIDYDASHHMGTTRMGRDPATSVVDPDCRLHGVENLYVAGSSVFPTSGCSNPTYTIVALAIRLADHLRERFGVSSAGTTHAER